MSLILLKCATFERVFHIFWTKIIFYILTFATKKFGQVKAYWNFFFSNLYSTFHNFGTKKNLAFFTFAIKKFGQVRAEWDFFSKFIFAIVFYFESVFFILSWTKICFFLHLALKSLSLNYYTEYTCLVQNKLPLRILNLSVK